MRYSKSTRTWFYNRFHVIWLQNFYKVCKSRCVTASAKPSCRPAPNCGSISRRVCWCATMSICSYRYRRKFRCRMSCSSSRVAHRAASRQSSPSCTSASGEGGLARAATSPLFLEMWSRCHTPVLGVTFLQMIPPASAGGPTLMWRVISLVIVAGFQKFSTIST